MRGRIALVTGAGQGIGRAIALRLAGAGAEVAVADLSLPGAEATAALARDLGVRAVPVAMDVTGRASVEAGFAEATAALGPIDVLVNNAGIFANAPFEELSFEQWARMLDVNLNGAFHASQVFVRRRLSVGVGGAIVNMSSVSGQIAFSGSSAYNVSKAALSGLTRCLAVEFGQHGIRCNAVAPGIIETDMTRHALADPALLEEWQQRIPMRRYGSVQEVADVALFLASDASAYVNGEVIVIDGGAIPNWSKPDDRGRPIRRDWYPAAS